VSSTNGQHNIAQMDVNFFLQTFPRGSRGRVFTDIFIMNRPVFTSPVWFNG
jgi:hypothetical protein